jgi:MATE family multidrug resistance protein
MFRLAAPVVIAELGWMTMGLVDTLMVGGLGPEAIGAVGMGSTLFIGVCIFAMGLLLGLDTLVSQAFGARRIDECHTWLMHGVLLALVLSAPIVGLMLLLCESMPAWGLHPDVLRLTQPYARIVSWSTPPLLLHTAFRRYLQGMGVVRPVTAALAVANVLNACVNWVLIFGRFGAPALGVAGAAWATVAARCVMAAVLFSTIAYRERGLAPLFQGARFEVHRIRRLLALGFPAAGQVTLEVGVFAAATALAGRLPPVALAAHQIAINIASFTFMVPLGIASAAAVRVGHAIGARDRAAAWRAGWTAFLFGGLFMSCAAATFLLVPRFLIGAFTDDASVIALGVSLLFVAAVFQLFDGTQAVATGVLRGLGDTRTPMLWNLAGHWLIGLPLAYTLCFVAGFGVVGLWWGLSSGLIICAISLFTVWTQKINRDPALHLRVPPAEGTNGRTD